MRRDKTSIRGDKTRQVRNHCLFLLPVTLLAACASQNPAPESSTQNTPTSLISTNQMTDSMPTSGPENAHNTDLIDNDESVNPSRSMQKEQPNMTILVIENQEQANQEVARLAYNMEREAQKQQTPNDIEETDETLEAPAQKLFHYGFNQVNLSVEDIEIIKSHGRYLTRHPEYLITIHGHTDNQGVSGYNHKLARQRAQKVANILKSEGVLEHQIKIVAWGSEQPVSRKDWLKNDIAPDLSERERQAQNRRVELEYTDFKYAITASP